MTQSSLGQKSNDPETLSRRIRDAHVRRLRHIVHALLIIYTVLLAINFSSSGIGMLLVLSGTLIALLLTHLPLRRNNPGEATTVLIGILSVSLALVMWQGSGLRSSAMLAYPGLLVFCLMVGSRRLFFVTWLGLVLYMTFLVYATHQGWRTGSEHFSTWLTLIEFIVIVSAMAYVIRMLAGDMFELLGRLERDRLSAQASQREAQHQAMHDHLTGLPDRGQAQPMFEHALANSLRANRSAALVFIDIDHFKEINDRFGHAVGDQVLLRITRDITKRLRKTDTLIRYAGDEFLLVLSHVKSRADIDGLLDTLAAQISSPLQLENGDTVSAGISMGVVVAPEDGGSYEELLKRADVAMYRAKEAGRNQYQFFSGPRTLPSSGPGV